jgi:hypothetical protein
MTSKFIVGGCVVSFLCVLAAVFVVTEPKDDMNSTSLILGSNGDSDILILTSKSAALLPAQVNAVVDLWGIKPVEFLKALKMERASTYPYFFRDPIKNWISKQDLPGLLALTDSKEPCAPVALMSSSTYNSQGSTMGQEALFMIEGYRKGEYPPALNSGGYDEAHAKELTDWCRNEIAKTGD